MKKLILLSVIAMSILVARDCRYEEQELDILIRQYEDLQDEAQYESLRARSRLYTNTPQESLRESAGIYAKYNIRFNRLNQRIEQQKQRLNNCRNGK